MQSGELAVAVEIPPGYGRDLTNLRSPEVGFWIDGAMPFRGETTKGYVTGLMLRYGQDLAVERIGPERRSQRLPWRAEYRRSLPLQPGFQERLRDGPERRW